MPESPPERVEEARAATVAAGDPFAGLEGAAERLLLVDPDGFRLGGGLVAPDGRDVTDDAAAVLAGTAAEAVRAARLLELGQWHHLTVEAAEVSLCLLQPTADTALLAAMDAGLPAGQLAFFAERAAKSARGWLERVR
jgi:predicted regulator of Ras-like GTPase activity (Roadblock/LC7/MglB family)